MISQVEEFDRFEELFEPTEYIKYFKFDEDERKISFFGDEKDYIQLLCKTIIPKFEPYSFKVKITNCKKSSIFIGVASKQKQKNARFSHKSGYAFCLYGGGRIWFGSQFDLNFLDISTRLSEGDEIVTVVNRSNGKIEWIVNGKIAGRLDRDILQEAKYEWVPYFEFKRSGDEIQWLNWSRYCLYTIILLSIIPY